MRRTISVKFWKWHIDFSKEDNRFSPSEEGLEVLKAGWENGELHRVPDMYSYMRQFMQQYDNPKAKL